MDAHANDRDRLEQEINDVTNQSLDRLFELWKVIGIDNLREARLEAVFSHVKNLYGTMIQEEEANLDKITKNIQKYNRERTELRRDLGTDYDDSGEDEMTLVEVEHKIRTDVARLRELKEKRMQLFHDVRAAEKIMCDQTGEPMCEIHIDRMPTDAQVRQVEKHTVHLKEVRSKREKEFERHAHEIRQLYERLEIEPRTSRERDLVCSNVESLVLSQDTMEKVQLILRGLEDEMQCNYQVARELIENIKKISEKLNLPCDIASKQHEFYSTRMIDELRVELGCLEEERKKHMAVFIKSASQELQQIWDQCYAGTDAKQTFNAILDTKMDDEENVLAHYESNIKAWQKFYDDHRLILSKIGEWYSLWNDRLQLETCIKDPSRLQGRSAGAFKALQDEERKRRRVNKGLPKVVKEIEELTQRYLQEKGKEFLIHGMTFNDLNEHQQTQHEIQVNEEKERKKQEKKRLMVQESIYGVTKTPIRGNRTLRQVKRLQHDTKGPSSGRSFATPGARPPSARKALRDRNNDTFVQSGNLLTKDSIATVNDFRHEPVASSTMNGEEIRKNLPTPIKSNAMSSLKKYNSTSSATATRSRTLRQNQKIPFLL